MLPAHAPLSQVGRWFGAKSGEGLRGGRGIEIWLQELMEPGESSVGAATSSPTPTVDSGPRVSLISSDPARICQDLPLSPTSVVMGAMCLQDTWQNEVLGI